MLSLDDHNSCLLALLFDDNLKYIKGSITKSKGLCPRSVCLIENVINGEEI